MTNLSIFTKKSLEKSDDKSLESKRLGFAFENRFEQVVKKKRYTKDYQYFGVWLAQNLGDEKNIPLYIRLAKTQQKGLLEGALSYVKDYPNARSRGHLFLWYLKGKLEKSSINRQFDKSIIKKKSNRKLKTKQVELISKDYEKYALPKEEILVQERIDNFFTESGVESSIQITNPKEYLYEKLINTRKFADGIAKDQYFEIYKVDFFASQTNLAIDIVDERDFSLSKKTYFEGKKRNFASKKMKYMQITAEQIAKDYSRVIREILNVN